MLLEDFKEVHKALEEMRTSAYSTAEIKKACIACCGLPTFGLARSRNTASVLNAIGLWHKEQELFKA